MTFAFDLISDLHVETWNKFDWDQQATSPFCIVAGDIACDHSTVSEILTHLGKCYQGVFYIDGNAEHRYQLENLNQSVHSLQQTLTKIPNVVYLQDNLIIIDGVAIIATNGWWSYDFDLTLDMDQSVAWFKDQYKVSGNAAENITTAAYNDAAYLMNGIKKLQTHPDVKSIVVITHTVPAAWLVEHDIQLVNTWRFNTTGNPHMSLALAQDTENKIKIWCFGHYHQSVDRIVNGIRYTNNCRGRGDTEWCQRPYYPKRIEIK